MKKRWISLLLVLAISFSCLTTVSSAAATFRQEDVEAELQALMAEYCGTNWYGSYNGAIQCKGFADMIFNELFGTGGTGPYSDNRYYLPDAGSRSCTCLGILSPGQCTEANLRDLLMKARPGDYVQCVRNSGTQHSLIVISAHTTGVTFFDCNLKGSLLCASYFQDWETVAKTYTRGISLYRHNGYAATQETGLIFDANGGACELSKKAVAPGSAFGVLPVPERRNYCFDYWYMNEYNATGTPTRIKVDQNTVMTAYANVRLIAHWSEDAGPCAVPGHTWAPVETVCATCASDGYVLERCSVCGNTRNTQILPASGHSYELLSSIPATNVEDGEDTYVCQRCGDMLTKTVACQLNRFTDISEKDWYYPYVRTMVSGALMNGTSDTTFSPGGTLTRGMLVTILWRMQGEPQGYPRAGFRDVAPDKWYSGAVDWACAEGVVNGMPDGAFRPDVPITREQATVILFRYAPLLGRIADGGADLGRFADNSAVSGYALEGMSWAVACGVISGYSDGSLRPLGNADRAQIAKIIVTFLDNTAPDEN